MTNPGDAARNVIARALFEIKGLGTRYNLTVEQADAIIAALTAAGYEIVQRGEYIPIKIDPTLPENTIEVRSDVDSVRITNIGTVKGDH